MARRWNDVDGNVMTVILQPYITDFVVAYRTGFGLACAGTFACVPNVFETVCSSQQSTFKMCAQCTFFFVESSKCYPQIDDGRNCV
jgi:hypothetical protein